MISVELFTRAKSIRELENVKSIYDNSIPIAMKLITHKQTKHTILRHSHVN